MWLAPCLPGFQGATKAPERSRVTLAWGLLDDAGSLTPKQLGLGDGGFPGTVSTQAELRERGRLVTPGAAEVEVRDAGCHVRFPNGTRLLIDPTCRIHRRDGRATLAAFHGVTLALADGSTLTCAPGGVRGLATVTYGFHGEHVRLWRDGRAVQERGDDPGQASEYYLALGSGDCLYRVANLAPLLWCERVLAGPEDPWPVERALVLGDVLREGCALLQARAPRRSVQFRFAGPQADLLALRSGEQLAAATPGATDLGTRLTSQWLWELGPELRVHVVSRGAGAFAQLVVAIELAESAQALAEWTSTGGLPARLFQLRPVDERSPWRALTVQGGHPLADTARALGDWLPRGVSAEMFQRLLRRTAPAGQEPAAPVEAASR